MTYDWRSVGPGCYERHLYSDETALAEIAHNLSGATAIYFAATLKFDAKHPDFPAALGRAWKCLRLKHPQIATKLCQKSSDWLVTYDSSDWTEWIKQSLLECPTAENQSGLFKLAQQDLAILSPDDRNYTMSLRYAEDATAQACHFVLTGFHALFDGRSCVTLLAELFDNLAHGREGKACDNGAELPPHFAYAAKLRKDGESVSQADVDKVLKRSKELAESTQPQAFLPCTQHDNGTHRDSIYQQALSVKELQSIAKRHQSTVSSAVMVAVFLSLLKHAENTNDARYTRLDMACDARSAILSGGSTFLQTALVLQPITVSVDELRPILKQLEAADTVQDNFWKIATNIKAQFRQAPSSLDTVAYGPEISKCPQPWSELVYRPTVWPSLLGNLNDRMQASYTGADSRFQVHDPCMTIKNLPADIVAHIWTWQGQLQLLFNWHEGRYDQSLVESIATSIVKYLEAASR